MKIHEDDVELSAMDQFEQRGKECSSSSPGKGGSPPEHHASGSLHVRVCVCVFITFMFIHVCSSSSMIFVNDFPFGD